MNEVVLGKAIGEARKKAGLTQQELCQKADLSYSTLAKIERGAIKSPSVFTVTQIALITGTTVERLLGVTGGADTPPFKTAANGVSFIYFDVHGVLVRFFQRALVELAEDTGSSVDAIEQVFWHYNDAVCRGEMSLEEFNKTLAERIGAKSVDWQSYYIRTVEPIKEMQHCVEWAAKHYRVGLMSNIFPGFMEDLMQRKYLPQVAYTAVIDSSDIGAIKPEIQIYEVAQGMAEVPPEQILLIDDDRTNLMAAERHGWHVMWFDDYRPAESEHKIRKLLQL